MFTPSPIQLAAAMFHAGECQPQECCGVIADGKYHPLINRATDHDSFVMDRRGYADIARESKIEAVVHSHVYLPPNPSDGDLAMCEKTRLPWLIISWPLGKWRVIEPRGFRAPLIGRQWAWGSHDCFGCIRDGLHDYANIMIPDFPRDWLWWKDGGNIIVDQFEEAGFVRMPPGTAPQHCDVLGMRIASKVVNHLGLFLAPDVMLHQMMGRLSVREVYGGFYRDATELHLRHSQIGGAS